MSTHWLDSILAIKSLTLDGIDVVSNLVALAKKAEMIQGLVPGSIPIMIPLNQSSDTYSDLVGLYKCGTKFWDGYLYLTLMRHSDPTVTARFKPVFTVSTVEEGTYDPLEASRTAISQILLWVTRGGLANASSQAPLPRMIRNIHQFKEGEMKTEGDYMESVMSFDPKLLNLVSIFSQNATTLGFDQVFMQRMKLSIAGHKPLKVVVDNWALISPNLLKEGGTGLNDQFSDLVSLLKKKADAGMTYMRLHPGHKENVAQKYAGFYKTCLHAIIVVMSAYNVASYNNSLTIVNSRGLFNSDPFMKAFKNQEAGVINYQTTIAGWKLAELDQAFGDLWLA